MIERCHFLRLAFSSHFLYLFPMKLQVIFHQINYFFLSANPDKKLLFFETYFLHGIVNAIFDFFFIGKDIR